VRVKLRDEGRIFSGTATQVVQQMQRTAIFAAHLTLAEYVDWCVQNAGQMGLGVKVTGETVDERCASLLEEMFRTGFAEQL
jgi:hypothetical protein